MSGTGLQPTTRVLLWIGVALLLVVTVAAIAADLVAVHPPDRISGAPYARPSSAHWLGTDDLGRDLFAQLVHGARVSLAVGLVAATLGTLLGTAVGVIAGWLGGRTDAVAMRAVDLTLSLPFLVLVLVMAAYFGRGLEVQVVLISGVLWARPARLLRSQVLKVRRFGHVRAAMAMGTATPRILAVHVLPRLVPLLTSVFVRAAAVAVIVQAGVAFLGLGDPSRVSWGGTLFFANNGAAILTDAWLWWIVPPGAALAVVIVSLAFVGFALEERAEPRLASHGWRRPVRRQLPSGQVEPAPPDTILDIRELTVRYGDTVAVDAVSIAVRRGRVLGVVGASGSGKSTVVLAVLGLLPAEGTIESGQVVLGHLDLRRLGRRGLADVRGREIAVVPQAAMNLLDPTMTVHAQVTEVVRLTTEKEDAAERAHDLLEQVGVRWSRHRAHPHELSGGMRQRVVIAMAVANRPRLLIADETTTGLDVVTQVEILQLLHRLRHEMQLELVLVTHDLGIVRAHADDIVVMKAGQVVEEGPVAILDHPSHPHLQELLARSPSLDGPIRPWASAVDAAVG